MDEAVNIATGTRQQAHTQAQPSAAQGAVSQGAGSSQAKSSRHTVTSLEAEISPEHTAWQEQGRSDIMGHGARATPLARRWPEGELALTTVSILDKDS